MAEIELAPVTDRLDEDEVKILEAQLDRASVHYNVTGDHPSQTVAARLSEEAMTEFLDRLDAHDVGADIYLPVEFDVTVTAGDYRVASAHALASALEELKEELDVEDEDSIDDEDEDDSVDESHLIMAQLKHIWRLLTDATEESIDRKVPLHIHV
jgi:hypothetical protein